MTEDKLKSAFIEHLLLNGQHPNSVFAFAKSLKITEADFYKHFNSFKGLERSIWTDWLKSTISMIEADEAYANYTVREKLLAFFYSWIEVLKENRSYVLNRFEHVDKKELVPYFMKELKEHFEIYINDLIMEGKDTDEIAERPFSSQYEKAFWIMFLFVNKFWANDDSSGFEKTDAAIEKSVNLAFDLVGRGAVDSMLDLAKFLFQNRN